MGDFIIVIVTDKTVGVFHYRSPKGQYKLNYTDAQLTCSKDGAILASYIQLSYAQQVNSYTDTHTHAYLILLVPLPRQQGLQ